MEDCLRLEMVDISMTLKETVLVKLQWCDGGRIEKVMSGSLIELIRRGKHRSSSGPRSRVAFHVGGDAWARKGARLAPCW